MSQAERKAAHEHIRREREEIAARRHKEEAACYQRFAVEDCLKAVRTQARVALGRLRTQELELNDAQRREKAAERLQSIGEKERLAPLPNPPASVPGSTVRQNAPDLTGAQARCDGDAPERAQQQLTRAQTQACENAARATQNAERAARAREHQAQALEAAAQRRARSERAAQGRATAAPLPPVPHAAAR